MVMAQKVEKVLVIANELGIHARPAALFVKLAATFDCDIMVEKDGEQVNGKSIMGVMMLASSKGSKIRIIAEGDDAQEAVEAIEHLVTVRKFDEE